MVRISVVINTLNEAGYIQDSLESLLKQTVMPFEIIYVDGGSTDGTIAMITDVSVTHANVRVIVKKGLPDAPSHNLGSCESQGDIILLSGASIIFPPNALKLIHDHFESDSELVAITGRPVPIKAPTLLKIEYQAYHNLKVLFEHLPYPVKAFPTSASCLAIKRDVFLSIGCLDPKNVNNDGAIGIEIMDRREKGIYCHDLYYFKPSRRYIKYGPINFNKQFAYNVIENLFPYVSKISWLDSFKRAIHASHRPAR